MNEQQNEITEPAPAPTAPEAFAPMTTEDMIALARSYVESGTGKGIKKNDLVRFMQTLVAAANAEGTGAPAPDAQPATAAPDRHCADDCTCRAVRGEPFVRSDAPVEDAPAPSARAGELPETPPGNHSYVCSAVVPNDDGTSLHIAKRANRDYTRNEAIALGLDILRKVRAIS